MPIVFIQDLECKTDGKTLYLFGRIYDIMNTKVFILRVSNETPLCAKSLHKFMI